MIKSMAGGDERRIESVFTRLGVAAAPSPSRCFRMTLVDHHPSEPRACHVLLRSFFRASPAELYPEQSTARDGCLSLGSPSPPKGPVLRGALFHGPPQDIHGIPQKGVTPSRASPADITGAPKTLASHGLTPEGSQIYTSGDSVVILDARTLSLTRILAFWEAFPGLRHGGEEIDSLAVDSGMKIVRDKSAISTSTFIYA